MPKSLLTLALLLAAMLPVAGCNTPGGASTVSASQRIDSASYTEAMGKVRASAQRLDQMLTSQRMDTAKYEALVLLNLVDRIKQFTPTMGVETAADFDHFLARTGDMYASASKVLHFTGLHQGEEALDNMTDFIERFNAVTGRYGPGNQLRKLARPSSLRASR